MEGKGPTSSLRALLPGTGLPRDQLAAGVAGKHCPPCPPGPTPEWGQEGERAIPGSRSPVGMSHSMPPGLMTLCWSGRERQTQRTGVGHPKSCLHEITPASVETHQAESCRPLSLPEDFPTDSVAGMLGPSSHSTVSPEWSQMINDTGPAGWESFPVCSSGSPEVT